MSFVGKRPNCFRTNILFSRYLPCLDGRSNKEIDFQFVFMKFISLVLAALAFASVLLGKWSERSDRRERPRMVSEQIFYLVVTFLVWMDVPSANSYVITHVSRIMIQNFFIKVWWKNFVWKVVGMGRCKTKCCFLSIYLQDWYYVRATTKKKSAILFDNDIDISSHDLKIIFQIWMVNFDRFPRISYI